LCSSFFQKGSDHRRTAIERFSKVTHFLKDTLIGQNEFIPTSENPDGTIAPDITALMESFSNDLRESNNDGFEVIYKVDFKKLPDIARGSPLTVKDWQGLFDKEGRIINVDKMKERIFRGGLESNYLRREVWKFLLNYFPWSSTRDERIELTKQRHSDYFAMKLQWKSMNEQQKQRNNLFRDRESLIGEWKIESRSKIGNKILFQTKMSHVQIEHMNTFKARKIPISKFFTMY
jgi:hypothetical protein